MVGFQRRWRQATYLDAMKYRITGVWPTFVSHIEVRAGKKPEYGYRHIEVGRSNGNRQRMNKNRIHTVNCLSVCLCTQGKDVTLH